MRRTNIVHPAAAAFAGTALGIGVEAGIALLLYADTGFLATVGLLAALALGALAAGLWVGMPEAPHAAAAEPSRLADRWLIAGALFIAAGIFALFWSGSRILGKTGSGRALAVLLLIAAPAYAIGAVLSGINYAPRNKTVGTGGVAVGAALGAASGVLLAAVVLIPHLDASVVFVAIGGSLASFGYWWGRWTVSHSHEVEMDQKVAIITGVGAKGQVGYAIAQVFLARGARIAITDISPGVIELVADLGEPTRVAAIAADLTSQDGATTVAAFVKETYGRLDYLVNVAGGLSVIKPVADTTPEEWHRELERNASTVFLMTRAALPMLRERGGAVVNFASPAALAAPAQLGAYAAAKAAVIALTRSLAIEEKVHRVRVNALAPGNIDTEQNRKSMGADAKFVTREQIINAVMLLLGDDASGITGETIKVLGETIA